MRILIAFALWAAPMAASAQTLDLELTQQALDAGVDPTALENQLNSAIADELNLGTQAQHNEFISSMVEAASISAKGIGVDYASNINKFVFGGAFASGVHQAGFSFNRGSELLPKGGFGAQISLMAGVNVGMGGEDRKFFDRIRLYANGLAMRLPRTAIRLPSRPERQRRRTCIDRRASDRPRRADGNGHDHRIGSRGE